MASTRSAELAHSLVNREPEARMQRSCSSYAARFHASVLLLMRSKGSLHPGNFLYKPEMSHCKRKVHFSNREHSQFARLHDEVLNREQVSIVFEQCAPEPLLSSAKVEGWQA